MMYHLSPDLIYSMGTPEATVATKHPLLLPEAAEEEDQNTVHRWDSHTHGLEAGGN